MNLKSRIKICGFICFIPILIIACRLVYLQTFRHEELLYETQKRVYTQTRAETFRGRILDRNGIILAESLRTYAIALSKKNVEGREGTLKTLADALSLKLSDIKKMWNAKRNFFYVKKDVTPLEYETLETEINKKHIHGVEIEPQYTRIYPYGAGQDIIGAVNSKNIGLSGVELMFDKELTDKQESILVKKARRGGIIYEAGQFQEENVADIYLTIDALGQYYTEDILRTYAEKFKVKNAFALVQDTHTGEILAAASYPFLDGRSYPFQFTYEPGSTFKTIAVAAALDSGSLKPQDKFSMDNNIFKIDGIAIKDHQKKPYLNVTEILEVSSNIGAAKIASQLGAKKLYTYFKKFGFGVRSNVAFLGESAGILREHTRWKPIDTAKAGYGYTVSVSGVQLVGAYSAIANGGDLMQAHLISKIKYSSGKEEFLAIPMRIRQVIKQGTAKEVTKMLVSVVENGTGQGAKVEGFVVAGKTGTTEKLMQSGKYERQAHIASFCGFVPAYAPQLTILVVLDEPERALFGAVSAKIFSEIATKFLTIYPEANKVLENKKEDKNES